ncbi:MAG: hypothetical protein JWL83_2284, partial [Actinomycetia bacterium]|nr:hypothetical protein [Actinomycetes bacterium]
MARSQPVDAARRDELRAMKRRATALLLVITVVFLVVAVFGSNRGWSGYLLATAEASMVGGLADWFAVTALFRHPLGIPIPHTAVIRERKDDFGRTLGTFVQENFLTEDVVGERVRASRAAERFAAWLCSEDNAAVVARHASELAVALADVVRDEDVHRLLETEVARALDAVPLAPLAGRALHVFTANGRHQELLEAILRGVERFLTDNATTLRERFGEESPWWLPNAFEDRMFDRLLEGFRDFVHAVNKDPNHPLRREFDQRVDDLAERLQHSPELRERGEQLKHDLLSHPELRNWSVAVWTDVKRGLRTQAADPESELRRRIARAVMAAGERLAADPALQHKADDFAEAAVRYVSVHFRDEISTLVSGTISRWDADETSDKLELLLGRDLQYIRINGTVVG